MTWHFARDENNIVHYAWEWPYNIGVFLRCEQDPVCRTYLRYSTGPATCFACLSDAFSDAIIVMIRDGSYIPEEGCLGASHGSR